MLKLILSSFFILFFLPVGFVGASSFSSIYEFGERQIADLIENRDSLDNFDYFRYRFRLKQDIKDSIGYNVSYSRQKRDYETRDSLDSRANEYRLGLNFSLSELTQLQTDFGRKDKHYKNSPSSEYNRDSLEMALRHKLNPALSLGFSLGVINYDYLQDVDSNQRKVYGRLNADYSVLGKRLKLGASYRRQTIDRKGGRADRSEQIIGADMKYKFDLKYLKDISFSIEHGRDDTKEIEERDDNLTFRYAKWSLKTRHPVAKNLDTLLLYGQNRRDYFDSTSDYRGWFLENETDYEIFKTKQSHLTGSLKSRHKETDYHLDDSLNYIKDSFGIEFAYHRKKNFKIIPSFTYSRYNYPANLNRKEKDYLSEIELIKEFSRPDLKLRARYAYKFRDFRYTADAAQWQANLGIEVGL